MFLGVNWGLFVIVFLVALAATAVVVVLFSTGLRLLSNGEIETGPLDAGGSPRDGAAASTVPAPALGRPAARTAGGWLCIGVAGLAVLYALYLLIPQFHGG